MYGYLSFMRGIVSVFGLGKMIKGFSGKFFNTIVVRLLYETVDPFKKISAKC